MTIPTSKPFYRHLFAWLIWYALNSFSILTSYKKLHTKEWLLIGYNYLSLVVVFYAVAFVMEKYFGRVSWLKYKSLDPADKLRYLLKVQILNAKAITAVYLVVSIITDRQLSAYSFPSLFEHIDKRFTRVILYVGVAIGYSYYKAKQKKHNAILAGVKQRVDDLQQKNKHFNELSEELERQKLLN